MDATTICDGDSYIFGSQTLTTAGDYTEIFTSVDGCDSTVVFTLTVNPVYNEVDNAAICDGESFIFGTQTLIAAGDYTEIFTSVNGCDSIVILTLTVNPVYNEVATATIYVGDSYVFGTQTLTIAGDYTEVFTSVNSCDSTVVLTLTVLVDITQDINMHAGWNIISTYIVAADMNMISLLSSIVSDFVLIKNESGIPYWPNYGVNNIGNWDSQEGYKIKMIVPNTLSITGDIIDPSTLTITYPAGWSLIAYPKNIETDAVQALAPIYSNLVLAKDQWGWAYWPVFGLNAIGNLKPGEGYAIKMSNAGSFVYSNNTAKTSIIIAKPYHYTKITNTGDNMTVGIPTNVWETTPNIGDEIAVFSTSGALVGSAVYSGDNMAVPIWGNDINSNNTDGLVKDEFFTLKIWNNISGKENSLSIAWAEGSSNYESDAIVIAKSIITTSNILFNLEQNNPNPAINNTTIKFVLPLSGNVELSIYNILGEKLEVIINQDMNEGEHEVLINTESYSPGVYFYRLKAGKFIASKQMNIIK